MTSEHQHHAVVEEGGELQHSADTSENDEPIIHHHHNQVPEHDVSNSMNHTATASSSILPQTVSHEEGEEIMIGLTLSPSPTMDASTNNSSSGTAVASLPPIPYTKDATTTTTAADLSLSSIQQEEVDASLLPKPRVDHNTMQQRQQKNNVINNNSENNNTSTIQMDDRIKQLESSIGTLTELCQSLLLQNQQLNNRMIGHSRDGSEVRRHY